MLTFQWHNIAEINKFSWSSRYSYVDLKDTREYKPLVPKVEPKKMIRYRDNKIVSLRGEKFTEKDGELKKTKKQQIIQQQQLNSP